MKNWIYALAATLMLSAPAHAGDAAGAKAYIDGVSKQVLEVLKAGGSQADKQQKLEGIFASTVDIPEVGKFVLGRHWKTASEEQRAAYLAAYEPFVLRNYASKLTKYSGQSYKLREARPDGDAFVVTQEILDPGKASVYVDYRLQDAGKGYRLRDIAVEGVSLVATQRSEFNSIVSSKGLDYLISALKKQAAAKKA